MAREIMNSRLPIKLILSGVLLVGLFLRIYDLGGESLWTDEGISIRVSNSDLSHIIKDRAINFHTPFYFIILHYWILLFGNSEFATRFLSLIFGFCALFMIYKLGSLIFDEEVGIFASLLLTLSIFHIYYSQEVRMYSLLALLTLVS